VINTKHQKGTTMAATSHTTDRPRSFVTHVMRLSGVDAPTARDFIDGSCDTARKRLKLRPAKVHRTKMTSREKRHQIVKLRDAITGAPVERSVRRRKGLRVYHYTLDQIIQVVREAKPRKAEYKAIKAAVLAAAEAAEQETKGLNMRRLPRHKKWSKRRNRR
jgi:hypothetical protein